MMQAGFMDFILYVQQKIKLITQRNIKQENYYTHLIKQHNKILYVKGRKKKLLDIF